MNIVAFLQGATAMGCAVAGIVFLRYWHQSRDRLLACFAYAFWMLSVSYILLGTVTFATEWRVYVFLLRLLAFCTILYGIADKNLRR